MYSLNIPKNCWCPATATECISTGKSNSTCTQGESVLSSVIEHQASPDPNLASDGGWLPSLWVLLDEKLSSGTQYVDPSIRASLHSTINVTVW